METHFMQPHRMTQRRKRSLSSAKKTLYLYLYQISTSQQHDLDRALLAKSSTVRQHPHPSVLSTLMLCA
ncbi:hypothetical protein Y032_0015g2600 [Ancylostoma ceylanicum]|uniref:Uncharacterized protein n=1 Tax=Ancylostoma ceylanicum TaxID=53326 RepID=A0A016V6N6_9BILA|nr:hypothetical protein Y032_0015g2600 [Ancylostoma ceylanicum]